MKSMQQFLCYSLVLSLFLGCKSSRGSGQDSTIQTNAQSFTEDLQVPESLKLELGQSVQIRLQENYDKIYFRCLPNSSVRSDESNLGSSIISLNWGSSAHVLTSGIWREGKESHVTERQASIKCNPPPPRDYAAEQRLKVSEVISLKNREFREVRFHQNNSLVEFRCSSDKHNPFPKGLEKKRHISAITLSGGSAARVLVSTKSTAATIISNDRAKVYLIECI